MDDHLRNLTEGRYVSLCIGRPIQEVRGRAVVYQEARYRAAKQGLSCFVSGAPIQTKAVEKCSGP